MPELPEVETTVRQLRRKVLGRTFLDIWTDYPKIVRKPKSLEQFKKEIRDKKIKEIWRRGKNIIFDLTGNLRLLVHQKLTGHLLVGQWKLEGGKWRPLFRGPLADPVNRFIHLMFWLTGGLMLALSDLRKFAKVELWDSQEFGETEEIRNLGPEPLEKDFDFGKFRECLKGETPRQARGKIKQVLMDQTIIAGLGNIYSDEILWAAKIHPLKDISRLSKTELQKIYQAMKKILPLAIKLQGESISDYRTPSGQKGFFDKARKVYRREGEKCSRCGTIIKKVKIGGRSAHFCPNCQQL